MLTEATTPPLDLLLVGGTVVDPSQGLHARKDVGLAQGRVALVEDSIPQARARQVVDCSGLIVTPRLVDLHVHVYEGASHYGIEVDSTCLATGATTVLDLGSAGAWTFSGFRRQVIDVGSSGCEKAGPRWAAENRCHRLVGLKVRLKDTAAVRPFCRSERACRCMSLGAKTRAALVSRFAWWWRLTVSLLGWRLTGRQPLSR